MTPDVITSTLRLNKGGIIHHTNLILDVFELLHRYRLCHHIYNRLLSIYILKFYHTFLDHVSNEVIFHFHVFRLVMKHRILIKIYKTMVVTIDHYRLYLFAKKSSKYISQQHSFFVSSTTRNVLNF